MCELLENLLSFDMLGKLIWKIRFFEESFGEVNPIIMLQHLLEDDTLIINQKFAFKNNISLLLFKKTKKIDIEKFWEKLVWSLLKISN